MPLLFIRWFFLLSLLQIAVATKATRIVVLGLGWGS